MEDPGITLRQLRAFLAAAEAGSVRRAAQATGMSQPALSAQIGALEAAVGQRFFERHARGMLLTAEGRRAREIALRILDEAQALVALGEGAGATGTRLSLGVSSSIGPYLLPSATRLLQAAHPRLGLEVREGSTRGLVVELLEGTHDLVLTQLPIPDAGIVYTSLCEERLMLMMAADHPLAARESLFAEDLAGERILTLGPDFALTGQAERLCAEVGARAVAAYHGTSLDALRTMCALGSELALVPEFYLRSGATHEDGLAVRSLARRRLARTIILAWRQSQGHPDYVAPLVETLMEAVAAVRARPLRPSPDAAAAARARD